MSQPGVADAILVQ